jgi:hypothetical protein
VDSLLLELLAPRRLGVSCESPNLVEDHKKVCAGLTFVVGKGRIRVERDPALCGRLNEEVGHLGGLTEPRDKSCVSCVLVHCAYSCSSLSHHCVEDLFIYFWCVDFEKCPSQIYYFEHCGSTRTSHFQS